MSVWLWVLVVLGAAGVLVLLCLAVPIDLRFRLARGGQAASRVRVEWLFGLVGKDISGGRKTPKASKPNKKKKGPGLRALWQSGLVQRGLALLPRLLRTVSIRECRVRASVNAGDPAETGVAFALVGPLSAALAALPRTDVEVVPDFGDEIGVRGDVQGWVRIVPIVALPPLLLFALSPATWRGVRRLRKASRS